MDEATVLRMITGGVIGLALWLADVLGASHSKMPTGSYWAFRLALALFTLAVVMTLMAAAERMQEALGG